MKSVLISVQPKGVEKIANREQTIEVRKSRPKIETPFKCYIYVTKPKKWFRFSSWGSASNESLWLSNGKVKMCDGFEFWADGKEYEPLCCKVIGEFVCDKIYTYYADDFVGSEDFDGTIITEPKEGEFAYWIPNQEDTCLRYLDIKAYGKGKTLYGWHISDLKIYDKPKELSEFVRHCRKDKPCIFCEHLKEYGCENWTMEQLTRPPQSWCYVEVEE